MTQQHTSPQGYEKAQEFYEKNKNVILGAGVVVLLVIAFFVYRVVQKGQQEKDAAPMMAMPQNYFAQDSFRLALYGDGLNAGFLEIIDEYGRSASANLARFYAGVSFLQLGDPAQAIDFLEDHSASSDMLKARKLEVLGHAYAETNDMDKAAKLYTRAADAIDNSFFTPYYLMNAADAQVHLGNYEEALKLYERIKKEYPNSNEAQSIEKYISYARIKAGKS